MTGEGLVPPTVQADAIALPFKAGMVGIVAADPPYTAQDAKRYGTPTLNKRLALRELARVMNSGSPLIWLDTTLPLYQKAQFHHWGLIGVQRSTMHRTRLCSLFTRQ